MILSYKQHRDSVNKHNVIIQTLCVIRRITKLRLISYENVTMWIEKQVIIDIIIDINYINLLRWSLSTTYINYR